MGGFGDSFAGLLRSLFSERLDAAGTEDGAVLVDDAEGEFRAAEVKGQNVAQRNRKGLVAGGSREVILQADDVGQVRRGDFEQHAVFEGVEAVNGAHWHM